jgi:hypothetical protein
MTGVNLIPAGRVQARRRAARLRRWVAVTPLCIFVLAAAYGLLRAIWSTDLDWLKTELARADAQIQVVEKDARSARARIAGLHPIRRAARAVGDQPDWGALLSLVSSRLGHDAVLSACVLMPSDAGARAGSGKDSGRPERLTLALTGLARGQEAVSAFVAGLESAGVFDRVAIAESRRSSFSGADAVAFRVECLICDSIPEGGTPR